MSDDDRSDGKDVFCQFGLSGIKGLVVSVNNDKTSFVFVCVRVSLMVLNPLAGVTMKGSFLFSITLLLKPSVRLHNDQQLHGKPFISSRVMLSAEQNMACRKCNEFIIRLFSHSVNPAGRHLKVN